MGKHLEPGQSPATSTGSPGLDDINQDGEIDFRDAAIRAEMDSTMGPDTVEKAWSHALVRLGRMGLGFTIFIIGIIMLPAPGPGGLVVAAGLAILARDVAWADRLLRYMRKKMPGMAEEGPIPKSTLLVSVMVMAAALLFFMWAGRQPWFPL